jgi:hypothetical protein
MSLRSLAHGVAAGAVGLALLGACAFACSAFSSAGDATTSDATSADVVATDGPAGEGEAAAAAGWCASQDASLFCSDFDESTDVAAGYSLGLQPIGDAGDEVTLDREGGLSPPAAALSTASPHADGGVSGARLIHDLWSNIDAPDTLTCEASLRLLARSATNSDAVVLALAVRQGNTEHAEVNFVLDSQKTLFLQTAEVAADGGRVTAPALTIGAAASADNWTRLRVAITHLASGTFTAVASIEPGGGTSTPTTLQAPTGKTDGVLYVGVADFSPSLPDVWRAEFDNVICW